MTAQVMAVEPSIPSGRSATWTGRALSWFIALFLLMDGVMKLLHVPVAVEATVQLGYRESSIAVIGLLLVACTVLYLIPRTAVPGAVLLTAYLGGAVATHVRAGGSWFNILFPVLCGVLVWGGLGFRNSTVRSLLPVVRTRGGAGVSRALLWAGRIVSAVPAMFFLLNGALSLAKPPFVVEGTVKLGYPESTIVGMGVVVIVSTLLYVIPRTAVLGALLLTGYMGGAVATHVRAGDPASVIIMPIFFAVLVWAGLWLRIEQVRRFRG